MRNQPLIIGGIGCWSSVKHGGKPLEGFAEDPFYDKALSPAGPTPQIHSGVVIPGFQQLESFGGFMKVDYPFSHEPFYRRYEGWEGGILKGCQLPEGFLAFLQCSQYLNLNPFHGPVPL